MLRVFQTLLIFFSCSFVILGQGNLVAGVSIAEDTIPPHPSAILDIRSVDKAISIPRMLLSERNQISNPADGLTVYLLDENEDIKGLWYFNTSLNKWQHLTDKRPYYPKGAIIMYSGSLKDEKGDLFDASGKGILGSKMEGWSICNGENATPNLRGRFVVGASQQKESDYYLDSGIKEWGKKSEVDPKNENNPTKPHNKFIMSAANLPAHTHSIAEMHKDGIDYPHSHEIKPFTDLHSHTIMAIEGDKGHPGYTYRRNRKAKNSGEAMVDIATSNIEVLPNDTKTTFTFRDGEINSSGSKNPAPIDNRPPYYVVLYIIKNQ